MEKTHWPDDLRAMHDKYGFHDVEIAPDALDNYLNFRILCIEEELTELIVAAEERDPESVVDAIVDLCVFAVGTLDIFGVDGARAWNEVMRANMAKKLGIKDGRPNPFGFPDLAKPEGWEAPSHEGNVGLLEGIRK